MPKDRLKMSQRQTIGAKVVPSLLVPTGLNQEQENENGAGGTDDG